MPAANKVLIPLLVFAHLCVHGVLLALRHQGALANADFARGLLFAEVPLMALWLAWGRTNFVLRLLAMVVSLYVAGVFFVAYDPYQYRPSGAGASSVFDLDPDFDYVPEAVGAAVYLAVFVGAPLLVLRHLGLRVWHEGDDSAGHSEQNLFAVWQFSLWQLLCLMTAVALAIPVLQFANFQWLLTRQTAVPGGIIALGTLGIALVVLTARHTVWAMAAIPAIGLAELLLHNLVIFGVAPWRTSFGTAVVLAQALATAGSILVVRLAGYHLAWQRLLVRLPWEIFPTAMGSTGNRRPKRD